MESKYYRFLYHNVSKGLCFSASVGAVKGTDGCQLLYLCAGADAAETEISEEDVRLPGSAAAEHLDLLILADGCPLTIARAQHILKHSSVTSILMPDLAPEIRAALQTDAPGNVTVLTEHTRRPVGNMELQLFPVRESLAVYLGSRENPRETECMMNVKRSAAELPCALTVNAADLSCEMRCLLNQDVMHCKRHNKGDKGYFIDGYFLPGLAEIPEMNEILQSIGEERQRIRFAYLPKGFHGKDALPEMGTPGHQTYVLGPRQTDAAAIKAVTLLPFHSFIVLDENAGLCISGCYSAR